MPDKKAFKSIDDIFSDEEFHLIEEKKKVSNVKSSDERLIESFKEIQDFVIKNDREPEPNVTNVSEFKLYSRLKGIREDYKKIQQLSEADERGLLPIVQVSDSNSESYSALKKPEKLEDIFDDDDLALISDSDEGLFDFKHVPKESERASADFVARRKPCRNFEEYEPMFKQVHKDLTNGRRKLIKFKQDILKPETFYVHNGILLYLEEVDMEQKVEEFSSGERERVDGRTVTIFENGTMSNMLYRSLYKQLLKNGKAVTDNSEKVNEEFLEKFSNITSEDEEAGYIYVLKSKSTDPEIASKEHLHKIGYSRFEVPERIKNAVKEPTYLVAPVEYVAGWKCYNMNPQKFEQLIHNFFGSSCLEVDVFDADGRRHTPREWFIVPLGIIEETIQLIISGEIVKYKFDPDVVAIVER